MKSVSCLVMKLRLLRDNIEVTIMGKSRKNYKAEEREYEDYSVNREEVLRSKTHRKEKHIKKALKTRDVDFLLNDDGEDE